MKNILTLCLALSLGALHAQDCDAFYLLEEGGTLGYTHYDAKDKEISSSETTVKEVKRSGNAIQAVIGYKMSSKNSKEPMEGLSNVTCQDGILKMDLSSLLPPQTLQSFGNMEVSLSGDGVTLPNSLSEGQKLPDSHNEIKVGTNGTTIMTLSFDIVEYEVLARESVTTPAGSFDCYKLSYKMNTKTMLINSSMTVHQWYAKGVGLVKSETYNKKGALEGRMLLVKKE